MTAPERHAQTILARLAEGPARFGELETAIGTSGSYLRNILRGLLAEGKISRVELNTRVFVYYHGQTAPKVVKGARETRTVKEAMAYSVPVRKVTVRRNESAFSTAATVTTTVTLPAEPWSV
jgi:hypothetical protein